MSDCLPDVDLFVQMFLLWFQGKTPSTQLVSQLLQCSCSTSGEIEDSGILGLLQMLPSRHDLTELQYERDGATARLSPVKKARCVCWIVEDPHSPSPPPFFFSCLGLLLVWFWWWNLVLCLHQCLNIFFDCYCIWSFPLANLLPSKAFFMENSIVSKSMSCYFQWIAVCLGRTFYFVCYAVVTPVSHCPSSGLELAKHAAV